VGCCICQVKMGGCGGNSVFDRTDPRSILSVRWYTHRWYSQWWLSSFGFGCAILVAVKYPLSHPIEYWSIYIVSWYVSIYIYVDIYIQYTHTQYVHALSFLCFAGTPATCNAGPPMRIVAAQGGHGEIREPASFIQFHRTSEWVDSSCWLLVQNTMRMMYLYILYDTYMCSFLLSPILTGLIVCFKRKKGRWSWPLTTPGKMLQGMLRCEFPCFLLSVLRHDITNSVLFQRQSWSIYDLSLHPGDICFSQVFENGNVLTLAKS
jgi:hypothetical protein